MPLKPILQGYPRRHRERLQLEVSETSEVESERDATKAVGGRWTEVYLRNGAGEWIMISVSGGPDGQR
jgi:hypothetical protein